MHLWVDADACPAPVKDMLFRAAQRLGLPLTLVANQMLRVPAAPNIRAVQVPQGFDIADSHIAARAQAGDLVITADIPLAAAVVAKGAQALDPRGRLYSAANIGEALALRDFHDGLRESGVPTTGPAPYSAADGRTFARELDRVLARRGG